MKKCIMVFTLFVVLLFSILACGSSGVTVSTPGGNQPDNTTSSIESAAIGTTRSNPAPVGSSIRADDMDFIVKSIVRPADSTIIAGNMFNETPASNKEYMLVKISVTCSLSSDQQCSFSSYNLKTLGTDGVLVDTSFISGVPGLLETSTFYGGASVEGDIPFLVTKGDTKVLLVYQPFFGDSFYLSLP